MMNNKAKTAKQKDVNEIKGNNYEDIFDRIIESGSEISEVQKKKIIQRMDTILSYVPTIGFFGKTGAGKSSLCNALFGKDVCPVSDVEACTRTAGHNDIGVGESKIRLLDVPGVGENSKRDKEYAALYKKLLPELDVVFWVLKADDRAYSSDEEFYKTIVKPHIKQGKPFFFVLNQVDKIEPFREWDEKNHEPSPSQSRNISTKIETIASHFDVATSRVIPVSANENYNIIKLVDEAVFALPNDKKITVLKQVKKKNRSKKAVEVAEKGFWDSLVSGVKAVWKEVKPIIEDWLLKRPKGNGPFGNI